MQCYLSKNKNRNKIYTSFLGSCGKGTATLYDVIQLGYKLMRKEKLHHHFFKDHSLLTTAHCLAYYALHNTQEEAREKSNDQKITENEATKILSLFERRISERIPVEYITNEAHYCGHTFYVNKNVLVPRSIMNTRFNDFLNETKWENHRVLDLCTGSGCIGITLALLNSKIQVDLADISPEALEVADHNVRTYALNDRVRCIQSDLFENIQDKYDLIITNPPYVSTREYRKSPEEFKNEPKLALEAGKDGLDVVHKILSQAQQYLNSNGILIAEVGFSAAKLLKKKYPHIPFTWFKYRRPNGKESFFGMHCVLLLPRNALVL